LGVSANLQIVGHIAHSEVPRWLDQADIFINTSNYDTAPRSLLEAMANGLCVVSTNVGGIPFLADNNVEALLVNPNDPEAMALAVKQILQNPVLAIKLSRNARHRAEQSDWSAILPKWDELFSELIQTT
jgi:glycosyltransferase involved in cell wall biosynthesis